MVRQAASPLLAVLGLLLRSTGDLRTAATALGAALLAGVVVSLGRAVAGLVVFNGATGATILRMGLMAASSLLTGALFLGLVAVLILVADEIKTFFDGGETLIGRFQGRWGDLVEAIQQSGSPDDNWLVQTLRFLLALGVEMINVLDRALEGWGLLFTAVGDGIDTVNQGVDRLTRGLERAVRLAVQVGGRFLPGAVDALGSAALPGLSGAVHLAQAFAGDGVAPTVTPSGGGSSVSMSVSAPVTVTVPSGAGADPAAIADHVARRHSEHLEGVVRNAAQGLVPSGG